MADVTYTPDRAGMKALTRSAAIGDACYAAALAGRSFAESVSPVGETGAYRAGWVVERADVHVPGRFGGVRAGAVLYNRAPHAALVEWRNGTHVLTRTAAFIEGSFR